MPDSSTPARTGLNLSQPVLVDHQILFSAFELGWGFGSYALSTSLVIDRLGAVDTSEDSLRMAFHMNHERIMEAIAEAGTAAPGRRVILSDV